MKHALFLLLICLLCLPASAIEPRKRQLITQIIEVMNIKEGLEYQRLQNIDLMRKALEQRAGEKAHQIYMIRLRDRVMEKYADYTKELFDWYKIESHYLAYYDAAFTEAQLKELLGFLKSSTGQALLKSQGALAAQLQQQIMESAKETEARVDRMIQETIAEVGAEVQANNNNLQTASPQELETKAREGDPVAQYLIGRAYADGKGVEKNLSEAIKWFQLAADQGDSASQNMLGALYFKGDGVAKDLGQARMFFQKSAQAGDVMGAYSLGYLYLRGEGVSKDTKEAFRWLLQAANGGHGPSQYEVAVLYWNGDGIEKNLSESYAWILVAVEAKVEGAEKLREFANPRLDRDQVADGMMRSVELRRAIQAKQKSK